MTYSDIKTKVYFYTKTNSNSLGDSVIVTLINSAVDRPTSLIMQYDRRWNWDDTNQTDLPIATADLVTNQQDYQLSVAFLEILRVELKDSNGNWTKLEPFNQSDLKYTTLTDYQKTAGTPIQYELIGSSVFLYPKPSYTQTASLKIYYQRPASYFISTDTTKQPGFNSMYHELVPLWASYQYATANGLKNSNQLMAAIQLLEDAMEEDYSNRLADEPLQITIARTGGWGWGGGWGGWRPGR